MRDDGFAVAFSILLLITTLSLTIVSADAYEIRLFAPSTIYAGEVLVVRGETNLPIGTTIPIIFGATNRPGEQQKELITIQGFEKTFECRFPTFTLERGIYKVEALPVGDYEYKGDSKSLIVVEIINREDEIEFTSSNLQYIEYKGGYVTVSGVAKYNKNNGVSISFVGETGISSEERFYPTDASGKFSVSYFIERPDTLTLIFKDGKGYITTTYIKVEYDPSVIIDTPTPVPTRTSIPVVTESPPTPIVTVVPPTQPPETIPTDNVWVGILAIMTVLLLIIMIAIGAILVYWIIMYFMRRRKGKKYDVLWEDGL